MLKPTHQFLILSAATILLTACAGVSLEPGADQVKITNNPAPNGCQFVGKVTSRDVNGATQPYSSHARLQTEEVKVMRNQAVNLGANVIVMTAHTTTYTGEDNQRVNQHVMAGNAYRCTPDAVARVPLQSISEFSDIH